MGMEIKGATIIERQALAACYTAQAFEAAEFIEQPINHYRRQMHDNWYIKEAWRRAVNKYLQTIKQQ